MFDDDSNWFSATSSVVEGAIKQSLDHLHHLVIILGISTPPRSIFLKQLKMEINNAAYVNMALEASKVLKDVPSCDRRNVVKDIMRTISDQVEGDILLFDGLDVLLDPDLEFDPIRFLRARSHNPVFFRSLTIIFRYKTS